MSDQKLTKKDFQSDQEVRWCPGCGDYSVLATVQKILPDLGFPKENHVFISGIGCSSRFPYYMDTYGFHTIHGRAPAIATGAKVSNPDLSVWVITGDGDALSIGGNHFIHVMRRNVDLNILLFNNRIYGLTKGQYSPTSEVGARTKSTPYGSLDAPINPTGLALASGAGFVARSLDVDAAHLADMMKKAAQHKGTSIIEIYQNCNIFNDGAFDEVRDRATRKENQLVVEHGKPLLFGEDDSKGITLNDDLTPAVIDIKSEKDKEQILVYNENSVCHAKILSQINLPDFPIPMGVFYQEERSTYDGDVHGQLAEAGYRSGTADIEGLLAGSDSWEIK